MAETLNYVVLEIENRMELRWYPAHLLAQVDLSENSYRKAIYQGFGPLADFIFGKNLPAEKISMTSPVQVSRSQRIGMTSPVTVSGVGDYTVSFVMPAAYSLETLPKPKNPLVRITEIGERTMAVTPINGFFNERKVRDAKNRLEKWVEAQGQQIQDDFLVAGYDPPWVPWFLVRNEVMVRVGENEYEV